MVYKGKVRNGVIVLEGDTSLPEGMNVEIVAAAGNSIVSSTEANPIDSSDVDPIFRMSDFAVDTGITDLATNIDHYLYGHPKVTDAHK